MRKRIYPVQSDKKFHSLSIDAKLLARIEKKSIEEAKSLYEILNENLKKIMDKKMIIDSNLTRNKTKQTIKSFAVNKQILIEIKEYALEHNYTLKELLLTALVLFLK